MTDLAAGTTIRAVDFPPSASAGDETTLSNVSSTTYAAGTPEVSTTFTAPTSGRVMLRVQGMGRDDTNDNQVFITAELYKGTSTSGTMIITAGAVYRGWCSVGEAAGIMGHERATLITGLEAGETYFVRVMHRVSGGSTADVIYRGVIVHPAT